MTRRPPRTSAVTILLVIGLFPCSGASLQADVPIRLLSSATRNRFPDELLFDVAVCDSISDIASIQLHFEMRGQGSETVVPLDFEAGREVQTTHSWRTARITVPPGVPIDYYWLIADNAGNSLQKERKTVWFDDVRFDWQVLEGQNVAVLWYGGSRQIGQRLFDTAQISGSFPPEPDAARLSYAESLSAVEFVLEHDGTEPMATLLRAFSEGGTADEAACQAFGVSLDHL